jgi:hypothetical protein
VQNQPDLFGDFLRTIEVADAETLIRPGNLNVSLNPRFVAALSTVNRATIPDKTKQLLCAAIIQLGGKQPAKEPQLSAAMRHAVVQRFVPSYRAIAAEFMGQADGTLFREKLPEAPSSAEAPRAPSNEAILTVILKAIALYLH